MSESLHPTSHGKERINGVETDHVPAAPPKGSRLRRAFAKYLENVREDFEFMRNAREKYLGEQIEAKAMPTEVVKRIGLQMMVAVRTMHFFRDAGVGPAAQIASRLIRFAYGAEINWQSQWAPGCHIVHGNGLVVGAGARISRGCVLLHNVTLGDAFDQATGTIGGPQLGENVHVGPGCQLIGPIHVGSNSKLMAGSALSQSVPARSLVKPAAVVVTTRGAD